VPRAFDPLTNPGTSRVLFQLILGVTNPKEIADKLGVLSPTVIQQLHRLRNIGIVRLGEKRGKDQHYEIVSDRLSEIFLSKLVRFDHLDLKEQKGLEESLRNDFIEEQSFKEFLRVYLTNRLSLTDFSIITRNNLTISEMMEDFRVTLTGMLSNEKFRKRMEGHAQDQRGSDLVRNLLLWFDHAKHVSAISKDAFRKSLRQLGIRQIEL
jgi:predicted transcriptional regulator